MVAISVRTKVETKGHYCSSASRLGNRIIPGDSSVVRDLISSIHSTFGAFVSLRLGTRVGGAKREKKHSDRRRQENEQVLRTVQICLAPPLRLVAGLFN